MFDRKVVRKIFVPVRVGDRIRTHRELYEVFNDMDVLSVLICSGSAGSAISFGWMKTLLRDECLMRWLVVIGGWDDRVCVGKTRLKRP